MNPDRLKFLRKRFREAAIAQPDLKRLKTLLLRLGGTFIVAPSDPDSDVPPLIASGFVMSGAIQLKPLKTSMCHRNVATVWTARRFGIVGIATGYALTDDGLWRQHTWGILRDGILETTTPRLKYFGILLQGENADHFARRNLS